MDVHTHVTPLQFPDAPSEAARAKWPCMRCSSPTAGTVMMGETPFRQLDHRSWDGLRRIEDMDRDGVSVQVLSPMPELLSYWMAPADAALICRSTNDYIAQMISVAPSRFRGLGAVPVQDPNIAALALRSLKTEFGLAGVEIGSNIGGMMLGDPALDPFWAAAEAEGIAVFVHALHPVAAKPIAATPYFTAIALFPIDVAMAIASLIMGGVIERFPGLRLAFSHGGGAIGAILGRLDTGWRRSGQKGTRPSEQASRLFYDSNVYEPSYLRYIATHVAPGHVFAGTDYPYDIMQEAPAAFIAGLGLSADAQASLNVGAASLFLDEDLALE